MNSNDKQMKEMIEKFPKIIAPQAPVLTLQPGSSSSLYSFQGGRAWLAVHETTNGPAITVKTTSQNQDMDFYAKDEDVLNRAGKIRENSESGKGYIAFALDCGASLIRPDDAVKEKSSNTNKKP
ncbi:MAG: hypothetical protein ACHQAX_10020 [Gammaproteobacteria bacterium]